MEAVGDRWEHCRAAVAAHVAESPRYLADVARELSTGAGSEIFAEKEPEEIQQVVADLVLDHRDLWLCANGLVASMTSLLSERVFTTRVEPSDGEWVAVEPDLSVLMFCPDTPTNLHGGGELKVLLSPAPESRERLYGPHGWLGNVERPGYLGVQIHDSELDLQPGNRLGDGAREAAALRDAAERRIPAGLSDWSAPLVLDALAMDAQAFTSPTLPVSVLLEAIGLEQRGDDWGRAGENWLSTADRYLERKIEDLAADFNLGEDSHLLFTAIEQYLRWIRIEDPQTDFVAVADALASGIVAQPFFEFFIPKVKAPTARDATFVQRLTAAGPNGPAVGSYLAGRVASWTGDDRGAEALFLLSRSAKPDFRPPGRELALYQMDRGEIRSAISILSDTGFGDEPLVGALSWLCASSAAIGQEFAGIQPSRNTPCPCGSGRKFKNCCLHSPKLTAGSLRDQLDIRLREFIASGPLNWQVRRLAEVLVEVNPDAGFFSALAEPVVSDAVLAEGGGFERYLRQRQFAIDPDEFETLERWCRARRAVYEVLASNHEELTLRSLDSGVELTTDVFALIAPQVGEHIMTRVGTMPAGVRAIMLADPVVIPAELVPEAVRLLAQKPNPEPLIEWIAQHPAVGLLDLADDVLDLDQLELGPLDLTSVDLEGIDLQKITAAIQQDLE